MDDVGLINMFTLQFWLSLRSGSKQPRPECLHSGGQGKSQRQEEKGDWLGGGFSDCRWVEKSVSSKKCSCVYEER